MALELLFVSARTIKRHQLGYSKECSVYICNKQPNNQLMHDLEDYYLVCLRNMRMDVYVCGHMRIRFFFSLTVSLLTVPQPALPALGAEKRKHIRTHHAFHAAAAVVSTAVERLLN